MQTFFWEDKTTCTAYNVVHGKFMSLYYKVFQRNKIVNSVKKIDFRKPMLANQKTFPFNIFLDVLCNYYYIISFSNSVQPISCFENQIRKR